MSILSAQELSVQEYVRQTEALIDAVLEAKSADEIKRTRNSLGLAAEEMAKKQSTLVMTVQGLQSAVADLLMIDSQETWLSAHLGLRRHKSGSPLKNKKQHGAESLLIASFDVVAPPNERTEAMQQAVSLMVSRKEESAALQTQYDRGLTQ
jgi:hypothetical protein